MNVTAWSYSRWSDYDRCPLWFKLKHLERYPDPGSPAMERGNTVHKLAEDFTLGKFQALPPELKHFKDQFAELRKMSCSVEQNWGFRKDWSWTGREGWFGDDVWLRAKADVAVVYDDDTAEVIDHKTGKKYPTNEEQVELMALCTRNRYPSVTHVTARLWYLDQADDNEVIREYAGKDFDAIQKDWDKRTRAMFADRKFPPKPNDKCRWCPASKAKGGPCKF